MSMVEAERSFFFDNLDKIKPFFFWATRSKKNWALTQKVGLFFSAKLESLCDSKKKSVPCCSVERRCGLCAVW